ncbi:type II toxin-antitoxin system Phd/YefM family antitoxin [Pseudohongiella spirulinae]|uniref:Antitoxin n=1 Tax=Pseudohongiella spirulinae TaxID=1249552 RepID=A0A0S2KDJ0_9GAMM|nr:type II toxin-antitoxin system prevent-host-death family antitoxin [Pseudohongiella spirulinae]ALO46376.1 Prevent-host-death family protein [Pseudohongiella spirulinae]
MQKINVRETRERLSALLDAVEAGEEIIILRHGKPVARLTTPQSDNVCFPDRTALRASLPAATVDATTLIRTLRDEERY